MAGQARPARSTDDRVQQQHVEAGPASIIDVARRAGVSPSTVSRSLRGLPNVSPATRARVERAAVDLAYVASPAASQLASGRTATIGVVVPFATRWYFAQVVAGAESVLRDSDYDLLLYNLRDAAGRERFFARMPLRRRVDAVLLVDVPVRADELEHLLTLDIPIVVVGHRLPGVASVRIDDAEGAATVVRHLTHLGHERIAMIGGAAAEGLRFETPGARRRGYERALKSRGLGLEEQLVVTTPWGLEGGAQAMEHLLTGMQPPTAVFAESDEIAFGALRTLRRAGLSVPGRVSVVGFDDHEMSSVVDLTTVAQPVQEQGQTAATLLLDALAERGYPSVDVILPTRLVIRGSTAPPPASPAGS